MLCRTAALATVVMLTDGWRPESIDSVDHDTLPVRCHWNDAALADRCDVVLPAISASWQAQVDRLGFHAPMPDDDGILDVYITTDGTDGGAYVYGPFEDEDTTDGRMGCHAYMALDPAISVANLPSYVAHEFNHLIQFATDFTEPTLPVWEATATAAEAWTLDDYSITGNYVRDFQTYPWMGILGDGYILWDDYEIWSYHEYGAGMWILHMDAVYGDGEGSAGPALWGAMEQEGWDNEPDVLDAWAAVSGQPWEDALIEFTVFRQLAGSSAAPAAPADAATVPWGLRPSLSVSATDLAVASQELRPEPGVYETGSWHVTVTGVTEDAPLDVTVDGGEGIRWAVVITDEAGNHEDGDPTGHTSALSGDLTVGVINLGEAGFDADARIRATVPTVLLSTGGTDVPDDDEDTGIPDRPDPVEDDTPEAEGVGTKDDGGCSVGAVAPWMVWWVPLAVVARRRQ